MRYFVIAIVSLQILGGTFLLNRLSKQKYPISSVSNAKDDVARLTFSLVIIIWGLCVLLK